MNRFFMIVSCTLLLATMAFADNKAGGRHMGKHADRLVKKLQLTEEQKQPVADILKEQWAKSREIMQPAFEQVRPQMEAVHEETRQQLADILTEEQLQKYDKLSKKRHERMLKRHSHR